MQRPILSSLLCLLIVKRSKDLKCIDPQFLCTFVVSPSLSNAKEPIGFSWDAGNFEMGEGRGFRDVSVILTINYFP